MSKVPIPHKAIRGGNPLKPKSHSPNPKSYCAKPADWPDWVPLCGQSVASLSGARTSLGSVWRQSRAYLSPVRGLSGAPVVCRNCGSPLWGKSGVCMGPTLWPSLIAVHRRPSRHLRVGGVWGGVSLGPLVCLGPAWGPSNSGDNLGWGFGARLRPGYGANPMGPIYLGLVWRGAPP